MNAQKQYDFDKVEIDRLEAELAELEDCQNKLMKKRAALSSKIVEHKNKVVTSFVQSLKLDPQRDNFIIALCRADMGYHYAPIQLLHVKQMFDDNLICLMHEYLFIDYSTEFRVHKETIPASKLHSMISDYTICVVKEDVFDDAVQSCLKQDVELSNITSFREATINNSITVVD